MGLSAVANIWVFLVANFAAGAAAAFVSKPSTRRISRSVGDAASVGH
jgi:hypothetical protein